MDHMVVTRDEWIAARKRLMEREKELTRLQDLVNQERRALPWVKIDKQYWFDTTGGRKTLADLFDGRSQLIVYHFMFAPEWQAGCLGCSFFADHVDGPNLHLAHHDVTFVAVSRASLAQIQAYRQRMGWRFEWISSAGSDFNYDFGVSFRKEDLARGEAWYNFGTATVTTEEQHGTSVFVKDDNGVVYHTYSSYARGDERGLGAYMMLDLTPNGRQENGPNYNLTDWVKRHDEY
ncbi:MAG TPA: thioredoxin family protein [Candidatus Binataceae bacterium]|jgi:predicted dithiol-disulfide oxidoreductase (DUF899 family)|nr:thioredoxin family protein [Candidatus Binataceae bacterium]